MNITNFDILVENLSSTKEILKELNIRWCLIWGSLLGAIREKRIIRIKRDRKEDIDIALLDYDNDKFFVFIDYMIKNGFKEFHIDSIPSAFYRGEESVDIYRFDKIKNKYYFHHIPFPERFFDKLEIGTIEGIECPIPSYSKELLTLIYGNWRTPKPEAANIDIMYNNLKDLK